MVKIISRDEILDGYPKLDNIDELFGSDVLILPNVKKYGLFNNQPTNFPGIQAKLYYDPKKPSPFRLSASIEQFLDLGSIVIATSLISNVIQIYQYIKKSYENRNIQINTYLKIENNYYLPIQYKGKASDIDVEKEILDIKKEILDIRSKQSK